ncbi:MAG: hypothetical protein EXR72_09005 [Myxococcales bacterium]|nr:hypothetical protein [Myxococcales bacterium]
MMWALIVGLLAVGMVLLVAEVAILPGFGVAGLSAIALLGGGVALAWTTYGPGWGVSSLLGSAALAVATIVIAPRTQAGKALILKTAITAQHTDGSLAALIGSVGTAVTSLRPAGAIEIEGRRVDVVSDGKFIEAGTAVRVVSVEGARILVEEREG